MAHKCEHNFELVLLGESGVGKTCLLNRFAKNAFTDNNLTVGIDSDFKKVSVVTAGSRVKVGLRIWDTGGMERFRSLIPNTLRKKDGIFIVYDVSNRNSFDHLKTRIADIKENADPKTTIVLIGNKVDLANREIPTTTGKQFADNLGYEFYETSAKDGVQVDAAFTKMAEMLVLQKLENTVQLTVVGDSSVGKSSIIDSFVEEAVRHEPMSSASTKVTSKIVQMDDRRIQLEITEAPANLESCPKDFLSKPDGIMVIFDVTSQESYDNVRHWVAKARDSGGPVSMLLLANKCDCETNAVVEISRAQLFANSNKLAFVDTSIFQIKRVNMAFKTLTSMIIQERKREKGFNESITLSSTVRPGNPGAKSKCC